MRYASEVIMLTVGATVAISILLLGDLSLDILTLSQ